MRDEIDIVIDLFIAVIFLVFFAAFVIYGLLPALERAVGV